MTRKRYIKLKMAEGLSRNEATQNAREIVEEGISYQEDYDFDLGAVLSDITPEQFREAVESFVASFSDAIRELVPAISQAVEKMAEAANKTIEALRQEIVKEGSS